MNCQLMRKTTPSINRKTELTRYMQMWVIKLTICIDEAVEKTRRDGLKFAKEKQKVTSYPNKQQ